MNDPENSPTRQTNADNKPLPLKLQYPISYPFIERRAHRWGETLVLDRYGDVEVRVLYLRLGERTSVHTHAVRTEFQIPLFGVTAIVGPGAEVIELPGGRKAYLIPPGVLHGFCASCDRPGMVLSITFGRIENDRL